MIKRSTSANMQDLHLTMRSSSTLADVKARLQEEYEDRPDPACVTVWTCLRMKLAMLYYVGPCHRAAEDQQVPLLPCFRSSMQGACSETMLTSYGTS